MFKKLSPIYQVAKGELNMGCFSWNCLSCGKSLISDLVAEHPDYPDRAKGVALLPNGKKYIGEYDGYGRMGGIDNMAHYDGMVSVYHQNCWEKAGRPEYTKPSIGAEDQGVFIFEEEEEDDWL